MRVQSPDATGRRELRLRWAGIGGQSEGRRFDPAPARRISSGATSTGVLAASGGQRSI